MAQLLNAHPCFVVGGRPLAAAAAASPPWRNYAAHGVGGARRKVGGGGRHSCFFSDGRKQDQAKKALESALGGKKTEFEKWNKEIEKRESGAAALRGGGDALLDEAKQAGITLGALLSLYLLLTKGSVMFAVVFNSLLFVLRGIRTRAEFVVSRVSGKAPASRSQVARTTPVSSAKERIASKWGSD
ncbi:unnamed protein product [Spirodela intermedia]|uniref:Uncharacterized protein n=1 Tax=Spirodela intermedia TaxID=51605 RepID=A0A7I8JBL5_SPIIN|nr:unnamed protein product [Spirodela intermedia]CAA6667586.1 unnamed protein product [Spirodela intermedia]